MKSKKISKKDTIGEAMEKNPEAEKVLSDAGMPCIRCPMALLESVEEGCLAHGINPKKIIDKINNSKKSKK